MVRSWSGPPCGSPEEGWRNETVRNRVDFRQERTLFSAEVPAPEGRAGHRVSSRSTPEVRLARFRAVVGGGDRGGIGPGPGCA